MPDGRNAQVGGETVVRAGPLIVGGPQPTLRNSVCRARITVSVVDAVSAGLAGGVKAATGPTGFCSGEGTLAAFKSLPAPAADDVFAVCAAARLISATGAAFERACSASSLLCCARASRV